MKLQNIGIALSGGGIRAMLFHLGLFQWLAENKYLAQVKKVSSVSGASLCVGMIYAHSNLCWPSSEEFLSATLPSIKKALTNDLEKYAIWKWLTSPQYWNKKSNVIAQALESKWGVNGRLCQLTGNVMWYVNCTTYETGKRFHFSRERMGDYVVGYVENPDIPLSEIMAASAGFPGFIGPYILNSADYNWTPSKYTKRMQSPSKKQKLHLWDGGIYDNLGLESVFKPDDGGRLSEGIEFLIVSNASASINLQSRNHGLSTKTLRRILDISLDQVSALRSRMVMEFIKRTNQGMYLKIGNSAEMITHASKCTNKLRLEITERCLPTEQAIKSMMYPTRLYRPDNSDLNMLIRHGYEVADCTYSCYINQEDD